jgi:hypothetical protein
MRKPAAARLEREPHPVSDLDWGRPGPQLPDEVDQPGHLTELLRLLGTRENDRITARPGPSYASEAAEARIRAEMPSDSSHSAAYRGIVRFETLHEKAKRGKAPYLPASIPACKPSRVVLVVLAKVGGCVIEVRGELKVLRLQHRELERRTHCAGVAEAAPDQVGSEPTQPHPKDGTPLCSRCHHAIRVGAPPPTSSSCWRSCCRSSSQPASHSAEAEEERVSEPVVLCPWVRP